MSHIQTAVDLFREGLSCSQAILSTYGPAFGAERDLARRLAAGFGGGMGRMGATCGAVTGAIMVLGLKCGNSASGDQQAKDATYAQVKEFARRFRNCHGALDCRDLLGCEIDSAEGLQRARDRQLFTTICPELVRDAARILEELIG